MTAEARWVIQVALGGVFLLSAASKLRSPMAFAWGVADYEILPTLAARAFGLVLIPTEVFLALSHLTGWLLVAAVPLGMAILLSFAVAMGVNLARGRGLPCYCFGANGHETVSMRSLARLMMMISGELVLLFEPGFFKGSWSQAARVATRDMALGLPWILFVLLAAMWALSFPDLLDLIGQQFCKTCLASVDSSRGEL